MERINMGNVRLYHNIVIRLYTLILFLPFVLAIVSFVDFHVPAGAYVALVGPSGAGKSTLCSLIPRFYEITAGEITIDGQNVQDVTLKSLRNHIGIVQQDVYLFGGSIAENIRYGRPDATDAEIVEAAKNANAHGL